MTSILPPPPHARLLPILERTKSAYLIWFGYYLNLPKTHRYSLGQKVDSAFTDIIESVAAASFLPRTDKGPFVLRAIRKTDTLKILLMVLWEAGSLDGRKYIHLSERLEEVGRMLGGWNGQIRKQNSPAETAREK